MKKLFLILCLIITNLLYTKAIIFDLGGVLLASSKSKVARTIGLGSFASYLIKEKSWPQDIFNKAMDVLDQVEPPLEAHNEPYAYLSGKKIRRLPTLYCKWLDGSEKSEILKKQAFDKIKELDKKNFFSSPTEKKLTLKTIKSMFNPHLIARATRQIKRGMHLAQDLKAKGHDIYILSNWDKESFNEIYTNPRNKELFSLFDKEHIMISGEVGDYKPHTSFFYTLLKKFDLDPEECIFIDDQEENIEAAQSIGIQSFHLPNKHFKNLRNTLRKEKIL